MTYDYVTRWKMDRGGKWIETTDLPVSVKRDWAWLGKGNKKLKKNNPPFISEIYLNTESIKV